MRYAPFVTISLAGDRRRAMKSFHVALLGLAAIALPTACDHSSSPQANECQTFGTTLSVEDRMSQAVNVFNPGEPITFELQIANRTNAPATLIGSSCTPVVFEVFDAAQRREWGSADGIRCFVMLQPRTYSPLETVTESSTWDQKGSDGMQVPPGTYSVTANVGQYVDSRGGLIDCRAPLSKSTTFSIQ